jgi:hypothetical protein
MFYRHHDGYPSGTLPTLFKFMRWVVAGKLRRDAIQASGWLIILGHQEGVTKIEADGPTSWSVGEYEPTPDLHGDIEWFYDLNLNEAKITAYKRYGSLEGLSTEQVIKQAMREHGTYTDFSEEVLKKVKEGSA